MRVVLLFLTLLNCTFSWAQGPNSLLIEMTRDEASLIAVSLALNEEATTKLQKTYVQKALQTEDIIVDADPETNLLKEVKRIEKERDKAVKGFLTDEEYKLYLHVLEQNELQARSDFDSLQAHLNKEEFNNAVISYFDENVAPYITYYHQTYFKPALRQKHYYKINQVRVGLQSYNMEDENTAELDLDDPEELANVDEYIKTLKRLRKKYKDELDYISVSLGSAEREWSNDYMQLVKEHYKDNTFQKIETYTKNLDAYGVHYIVGGFSLLLYDVWYPRSYVESRDLLLEMLQTATRSTGPSAQLGN